MAYMEYPWLQSGPGASQYFAQRPTSTPVNTAQYPTNPGSAAWPSYAARFGQGYPDLQRLMYQDSPQTGYTDYLNFLDPNPNSAFYKYSAAQYPRVYQNYLIASARDPKLQLVDYLGGLGGQLGTEFGALSPGQRGEHPLQFSRWLA